MKLFKFLLLIILIVFAIFVSIKSSSLFLSKPSTSDYIATNEVETRGNPVHGWMIGNDHLPHMKVFFWVPINSSSYIPYANRGVRTFVIGHGDIDKWAVIPTGEVRGSEKLMYILVPKTFVFTHGFDFYKLVHLYYK